MSPLTKRGLQAQRLFIATVGCALGSCRHQGGEFLEAARLVEEVLGGAVMGWLNDHPDAEPLLREHFSEMHARMLRCSEEHQKMFGTPGIDEAPLC